jgi:biopolymer transport protein ExbB
MNWSSYKDALSSLFEQGGITLWFILFASILLWILILERYWFHWRELPRLRRDLLEQWKGERPSLPEGLVVRRIDGLVGDLHAEVSRNVQALQALTSILPLLGLYGTVSGMIKVFEVMTIFGSGNTRGMASGISEALVTTMGGLFTALSGIYFVSDLERRASDNARQFEADLVEDK